MQRLQRNITLFALAILAISVAKLCRAFSSSTSLLQTQQRQQQAHSSFKNSVLHVSLDVNSGVGTSNGRPDDDNNSDDDDNSTSMKLQNTRDKDKDKKSESSELVIPDDNVIRQAYDKWRFTYNKGAFDGMRYVNFKKNFIALFKSNAAAAEKARREGRTLPKPFEMNQYGDCSDAEYKAMNQAAAGADAASSLDGDGVQNESTQPSSTIRAIDLSEYFSPPQDLELFDEALDDLQRFTSAAGDESSLVSNKAEDDRIRQAYTDWCYFHGKDFDESRLKIFATHFENTQEYFRTTGKVVQLNQHANMTLEEYTDYKSKLPSSADVGGSISKADSEEEGSQAKVEKVHESKRKTEVVAPATDESLMKNEKTKAEVEAELAEHIRNTYINYCKFYGKEFNETRLPTFRANILLMEEQIRSSGTKIELDEYADLTPEECEEEQKKESGSQLKNENPEKVTHGQKGGDAAGGIKNTLTDGSGNDAKSNEDTRTSEPEKSLAKSEKRGELIDDNEEQKRIRSAYVDWCLEYSKKFNETRLEAFASNLKKVESYQQETGKTIKLNEFSDLTKEEYNAKMTADWDSPHPSEEVNPPLSTPAEVRAVYLDWCKYYGKEPSDWRFPNFQSKYLRIERHYKLTGEAMDLDENADLSPEEYDVMLEAKRMQPGDARSNSVDDKKKVETELQLKLREAEDARRKAEDALMKAELEARREAEIQSKVREAEEERRVAEEARAVAEAEYRMEVKLREKLDAEAEARRKAEDELMDLRQRAKEEARRRQDEEVKRLAEEEARRKAKQALAEAKMKAKEGTSKSFSAQADELMAATKKISEKGKDSSKNRQQNQYTVEDSSFINRAMEELEQVKKAKDQLIQERLALEEARARVSIEIEKVEKDIARSKSLRIEDEARPSLRNNILSLFGMPQTTTERSHGYDVGPKNEEADSGDSLFSFFSSNLSGDESYSTSQVNKEKRDWTETILGIFGAKEAEEYVPGRGTISLESKEKSSPFNFMVTPETTAATNPRNGVYSTYVEKNPDIFSFFKTQTKKAPSKSKVRSQNGAESLLSFLTGSMNVDETSPASTLKKSVPTILPFFGNKEDEGNSNRRTLDYETRRAIQEKKQRTRQQRASLLAAERTRLIEEASAKEALWVKRELEGKNQKKNFNKQKHGNHMMDLEKRMQQMGFPFFNDGKAKKPNKLTVPEVTKEDEDEGIMSWFKKATARSTQNLNAKSSIPTHRSSQRLKAGQPPTLSNWHQNKDWTITGVISVSEEYQSGTKITTSPVRTKATENTIVTTISGSRYYLGRRE